MSKLLDFWADMTGVVMDYALKTPPSSAWLLCYGQALPAGNPLTARLRQKLIDDAYPWGQDGSSNPLVPDGRGRVFVGKDNMGGTAAGRISTAAGGVDGLTLGATGGAATHVLTSAQMPSHAHALTDPGHTHTVTDPGHAHGVSDPGHSHAVIGSKGTSDGGTFTSIDGISNDVNGYTNAVGTGISIVGAATGVSLVARAAGITMANTGTGAAHPNVQPAGVMNKIIKL